MYRTEAMIHQHLYWPGIRKSVRKEVTNCDTFQRTKRLNIKYGKFTDKEAEEITCNKICVDLTGPYFIRIKEQKENLNIKDITMIYPVTGWFKILQYHDKGARLIAKLVETT